MIEDIMSIFDRNFGRLNSLISIYKTVSTGRGRKPTNSLDILRATVVLAHSTLEDYLRSVLNWRLPMQGSTEINKIPIIGSSEKKILLGELMGYGNRTIDEIIDLSIKEHLGKRSFSRPADITTALESISLQVTEPIRSIFPSLEEMMKRRHNIVHRADRDNAIGSGNHRIKSISIQKLKTGKKLLMH